MWEFIPKEFFVKNDSERFSFQRWRMKSFKNIIFAL